MLVELDDKLVLNDGNIALLFYIPDHCAGCKKVINVLENKDTKNWTIYKVNSESEKFADLIKQYEVTTAPTIIMFKDRIQVDKIVGLKNFIDKKDIFSI